MNFAENLTQAAARHPDKNAIVLVSKANETGDNQRLTYKQLLENCDDYAHKLTSVGIRKAMRVSFMVKPGLDFLPLMYALLKIGAIPVLIDPGMGRKNLLNCMTLIEPEAFIGVPLAHLLRLVFPKYFRSVSINISLGPRILGSGYSLQNIPAHETGVFSSANVEADETSAIIFTTGSTGPPKGVVYTHGMFSAQKRLIEERYGISPDDIDMPGFAMFAIFSVAMGMTVILPEMDPTRPVNVNPANIIKAINEHSVTFSFGSPALWNTVSKYCVENNVTFPSLKRILMAGAPIPWYLHKRLLDNILPEHAEIYTPYGATECLLSTSFEGSKVVKETHELTRKGFGCCVGQPYPGITVKIIKITDKPLSFLREVEELPSGQFGEIIVKGEIVSREYFHWSEQTELHKIYETDQKMTGPFWHRIGDVGYFDDQERLWFCGRKSHRVETGSQTMCTVCCEAIYNEHPDVFRSALVGLGENRYKQVPIMIIEPVKGRFPKSKKAKIEFRRELDELASNNQKTKDIGEILFHRDFPVDIRHNAKIFREKLAVWAKKQR